MSQSTMYNVIFLCEDEIFCTKIRTAVLDKNINFISETSYDKILPNLNETINAVVIAIESLSKSSIKFLKEIKNSDLSHIPLIAILDTEDQAHTKSVLKMGFNDYVSNDIEPDKIVKHIFNFLYNIEKHRFNLEHISVAIIDDDSYQALLHRIILKTRGIENVEHYISGEAFFSNPKKCDLYLVDVVMDKMSGIKVVEKIKILYPDAVVFVVSAVSDERIITSALSSGADDFLDKPLNSDILFAKMLIRLKK